MRIFFVRHTEFDNPANIYPFHLPIELSEKGIAHAKRIGEWFLENGVKNIPLYSSPIRRTIQTSEILKSYIDSEITVDERLIETSCPNLQGKAQPPENAWILELEDPSRESQESILKRMLNFYNEKLNEDKDYVAVSHGDPITILYYHLRNMEIPKYLWDPTNSENVIQRGDIVKVEVKKGEIESTSRIKI